MEQLLNTGPLLKEFCEDSKTYFKSGFLKQLDVSFTNCFGARKVYGNFEKRVPGHVNHSREKEVQ